jgi:hypothetical protein
MVTPVLRWCYCKVSHSALPNNPFEAGAERSTLDEDNKDFNMAMGRVRTLVDHN